MINNQLDFQYIKLLEHLLQMRPDKSLHTKTVFSKDDRTGTGTFSTFGWMMKVGLQDFKLPVLTSKKILLKSVIHELLWFLKGDTNIKYLVENDVNIWTAWPYDEFRTAMDKAKEMGMVTSNWGSIQNIKDFAKAAAEDKNFAKVWGELGPVYGKQMTAWDDYDPRKTKGILEEGGVGTINQIQNCVDLLKNNPDSRRILVDMWNPAQIDNVALPPCHYAFQFYSRKLNERERDNSYKAYCELHKDETINKKNFPKRELSIQFNMRSVDVFLGMPFNLASYGILLHMMAQVTGHTVGNLSMATGDTHLYKNHVDQAKIQIKREGYDLPQLKLNRSVKNIFDFKYEDFSIENYKCDTFIKAPISV